MEMDKQKSAAAWSSVIWSGLLACTKLIVGLMTGSLGILSEALHSLLDLLAAGGTVYAVKISALPADEDHPYGHGKVENLMALGETILLLTVAAWVIMEGCERLWSDSADALHVETSAWAFAVVCVSIFVDVNRAAMLKRVAKETRSAALEADAAHFSTDIWSSAAVLLGITGAAFSSFVQDIPWLYWFLLRADVFASLIVAGFILHVCRELGFKAINDLMDKADNEAAQKVRQVMQERMPSYPVLQLRVREVGNKPYVDMVVRVPRHLHVDTAHEIADAIETLVSATLENAETMVHMQPLEEAPDTPEFIIRRLALTHRFGVHGVVLMRNDEGQLLVAVDLELPRHAALGAWQVAIDAFRSEIKRHLKADLVALHVEPDIREVPIYSNPLPDDWEDQVRQAMIRMGAPLPVSLHCHMQGNQRFCLICIPQEASLTVEESHTRLTQLNKRLAESLPPMAKIMVTYTD